MEPRPWTTAALLAASVLLHVAVLVFLLDMLAPRREKTAPAPAMDLVWAVPVKSPVPEVAQPAPLTAKRPVAARRPRASKAVTARVDDQPVADQPVAAPLPVTSEPVFDRQAALMAARKLAGEKDPARAGSVGAEIEARRQLELTQDEKMGRAIASGKRTDCLGPNANADLLSPLLWLLDKKGNGCKM